MCRRCGHIGQLWWTVFCRACLGVYADVVKLGVVRRGDTVRVLDYPRAANTHLTWPVLVTAPVSCARYVSLSSGREAATMYCKKNRFRKPDNQQNPDRADPAAPGDRGGGRFRPRRDDH